MLEGLKKEVKESMDKSVDSLVRELAKIRTGKATPTMLDVVKVNYYGALTPLNQVAAISCPDAKSFLITPWEASVLKDIEAGIVKADLGLAPMNDGKVIRLKVPDLTEERRRDLVKLSKKVVEEGKVAVRMARRDANESLKKLLKDKAISEDDNKRVEAEVQKITDEFIAKVDKIAEDKEKDIMGV
ncbi:MAG: ribosome recycling factor [Bdellovibrionales bacterium CG10_big_fil_rev_8_21_14_0_10_45_34]|nr:MAG: ribosome recycling factor [Bdellovibrionales bacterium CG10_big_fil_rev_8_21_14_0_10_45_34]